MRNKNEDIEALHALQLELEEKARAEALAKQEETRIYEQRRSEFEERFRAEVQSSIVSTSLRNLFENSLLRTEFGGIWELLRRQSAERHQNRSFVRRALIPNRSRLLKDSLESHIQEKSILPDIDDFLNRHVARYEVLEQNLEDLAPKKASLYWDIFRKGLLTFDPKSFHPEIGSVKVEFPSKPEAEIKIRCIVDYEGSKPANANYSLDAYGLDLPCRVDFSLEDTIAYLADFLRKNQIFFTPRRDRD